MLLMTVLLVVVLFMQMLLSTGYSNKNSQPKPYINRLVKGTK